MDCVQPAVLPESKGNRRPSALASAIAVLAAAATIKAAIRFMSLS
jgi:hypothetical protein